MLRKFRLRRRFDRGGCAHRPVEIVVQHPMAVLTPRQTETFERMVKALRERGI